MLICIAARKRGRAKRSLYSRSRWMWLSLMGRLVWTVSLGNKPGPTRCSRSVVRMELHRAKSADTVRPFKEQSRGHWLIHGSCPPSMVSRLTAHKNARPQPDITPRAAFCTTPADLHPHPVSHCAVCISFSSLSHSPILTILSPSQISHSSSSPQGLTSVFSPRLQSCHSVSTCGQPTPPLTGRSPILRRSSPLDRFIVRHAPCHDGQRPRSTIPVDS